MRQATRKGLMTVAAATGVLAAAGGYAHADSGAHGHASDSPGVLSGNSVQAPVDVPVNVCGNTVDVVGALNPSVGNSCANQSSGQAGRSGGRHAGGPAGHGAEQAGHGGSRGGHAGGHGGRSGPGAHGGHGSTGAHGGHGGAGGAHAGGHASGSPGVLSGNHVQAPVHVPVNVCGNSVDVVGLLNPTTGNDCVNGSVPEEDGYGTPPREEETPGTKGPAGPGRSSSSEAEGTPARPTGVTPAAASSVQRPAHTAQLARTGGSIPLGLALPTGAGALLAGAVLYRKARAAQ